MTNSEFDVLRPLRLTAIEYRGTEPSGRSRPLFVDCRAPDGSTRKVVLKLQDPMVQDQHPWRTCLSRELIGAILARHLGLNVPDYAIVEMSSGFVRALAPTSEAERVRRSQGPNFGSVLIEPVLADLSTFQDHEPWEQTICFDALGFNADRKHSNPNVVWTGAIFYLIDHGLLAPTWTAGADGLNGSSLYGEVNIHTHAAFERLRTTGVDFEDLKQRWQSLVTPAFLNWVRSQVPAQWSSVGDLDECFSFLAARSGIGDMQVNQLREHVR